jgi:hypothetical protein
MRIVESVNYQPISAFPNEVICLGITPRQSDILYPLKGIECFATFAEASFWVIMKRKPKDALVLASIGQHGGYCLIGYANL